MVTNDPGDKTGGTARTSSNLAVLFDSIKGRNEMLRALPPGARWITVRATGPRTDSHAVMIQPIGDGAYRVIGGASGKLNYLKLTGVRSEAEHADRAKAKAGREDVPTNRLLDHCRMIPALPDLLRVAAPAGRLVKDRGERTHIVALHAMVAPLPMAGRLYRVMRVIRRHTDGRAL